MNYDIVKYRKSELHDYILSDEYKALLVLPISHERAISHINNPRLDDDDLILITIGLEGELLGYRTIMADFVFNAEQKIKVGWISGTWIDPKFRRKGLATLLFNEIYKDWNGRLMYTNYSPSSKKVYDKIGLFDCYKTHIGRRFYIISDFTELLPKRWPIMKYFSNALMLLDEAFNTLFLPFLRHVPRLNKNIFWTVKTELAKEEFEILFNQTLTKRGVSEYNWFRQFPWVITSSSRSLLEGGTYFFSWKSNRFEQFFLKGTMSDEVCLVMISIKDHQMKIPYVSYSKKSVAYVAEKILDVAQEKEASYLDVFDESLVVEMKKLTRKYIVSKSKERKYMVSKEIIKEFPETINIRIPDGEGDVVFV